MFGVVWCGAQSCCVLAMQCVVVLWRSSPVRRASCTCTHNPSRCVPPQYAAWAAWASFLFKCCYTMLHGLTGLMHVAQRGVEWTCVVTGKAESGWLSMLADSPRSRAPSSSRCYEGQQCFASHSRRHTGNKCVVQLGWMIFQSFTPTRGHGLIKLLRKLNL